MNKRMQSRIALASVVAAMLLVGAPVRAAVSDDAIAAAIKESYVYSNYLKDDHIKTDVTDGVVTLSGSVAAESHKALAQDTAENIGGVVRVVNELETKAEIASDNADTWIGRKVKFALLFHRNVNAGATTVAVKDGVVTLSGVASSVAQKDLTAEYAKDIEGVVSVVNQMTIATAPVAAERTVGQKIDDASITAQVKAGLSAHKSTRGVTTQVTTRDGKVTLTGIAANDAEKSLVTKLVSDIQGVSSVNNEMTIAVAITK
jgi:hyperosmotically inducible protein